MGEETESVVAYIRQMLADHFPHAGTLQQACQLSEEDVHALYERAYTHYNAGEAQEAAQAFGLLATLNPLSQLYWMGLAGARQLAQEYDKALHAYALAALLDNRDPAPHYHVAQCYIALGNNTEAAKALELAETTARAYNFHQPMLEQILALKHLLSVPGVLHDYSRA